MRRSKRKENPLLDDPELVRRINSIVMTLVHAPEWREDFRQEALIHFWHTTSDHPGKGLGWYLRSCYFRLRNLLKFGRSVDSLKHYDLQYGGEERNRGDAVSVSEMASTCDVRQEVIIRDTVSELVRVLRAKDRQVLLLLAKGNSVHDVAELLHARNSTINRARKRIATAATKIGCAPLRR